MMMYDNDDNNNNNNKTTIHQHESLKNETVDYVREMLRFKITR